MSNRVSGFALKRALSIVSLFAVSGALAGCSSMGGFGGYGLPSLGGGLPSAGGVPLVTGATAGQVAGNLNQAMPTALPSSGPSVSSAPGRTSGPYLPPADIGPMPGAASSPTNTVMNTFVRPAQTVISQPLPPLTPPGSNTTMSAQPSAQPVSKPVLVANTAPAGSSAPRRETATGTSAQLNVVPDNAYVHHIQSGESLYSIARQYKVSTAELVGANKLASADKIYVGQALIIPGRTAAPKNPTPIRTAEANVAPTTPVQSVVPARREPRVTTASVAPASKPALTSKPAPAPTKAAAPQEVTRTASVNAQAPVKTAPSAASSAFVWPVTGSVITNFASSKSGINIAAKEGTAVRAADSGTVIYVGNAVEGFGNLVLIKHDNGYVSAYAHLKSASVQKGDTVGKGQAIGAVGMTGSVSRPQLHFELRQGATPVDPMTLLAG